MQQNMQMVGELIWKGFVSLLPRSQPLVQDMYAYSIASSQHEAGPIDYELHPELMAQPPFDPFLEIQVRYQKTEGRAHSFGVRP